MARVVIVSNRIPLPGDRGARAGGLAVALRDAIKRGGLWFGWSGKTSEAPLPTPSVTVQGRASYATIDLDTEDYRRFYAGFSNGTLWPLLHSRLGLMEYDRAEYAGYEAINAAYAKALAPLLTPDDVIWIHDYQLIPLAHRLREAGVRNRIGFFLHVPFVPASVFRSLPCAKALLQDFCAYDVVGLQTDEHLKDFLDCMTVILGAEVRSDGTVRLGGARTLAIADPIGIDGALFARLATRTVASPEVARLNESLVGRALIIGADRLDYSKGLPNRVVAFERLLSRFPEHRQKVSYLQIAAASREEVKEYRTLRRDLDRAVGALNGKFAEFDWVPLRYMTRAVARPTLAGFYRVARIGLVTPLRDGMNLVAKEYVAAQDPADPGVLILSCFAGAAEEMTEAVIVNPYDADAIAEAMRAALMMPLDERRMRHAALLEKVMRSSANAWSRRFLTTLQSWERHGSANLAAWSGVTSN